MKAQILYDTGRYNVAQYRDYHYFHHWTGMSIAVLPILMPGCQLEVQTLSVPKSLQKKVHTPMRSTNNACIVRDAAFGFRKEDLPCWQAGYEGRDQLHWTCVTGGVELEELGIIPNAMYRELLEEMGLVVDKSSCITEGPMYTGKGSNLRVVHFALMITEGKLVDRKPDSPFDANAEVHWLSSDEVLQADLDLHSRHLLKMAKF